MVKVDIPSKIVSAIQAFNSLNNKYLVSLLWLLVLVMLAIAVYGEITDNVIIVLQAMLLIPVGTFAAFGAKAVLSDKNTLSAETYISNTLSLFVVWMFSFSILRMIVPFAGSQIESYMNTDSLIVGMGDTIIIYAYFEEFYQAFMVYLLIAYIVRFVEVWYVGVWLKGDGTGQTN